MENVLIGITGFIIAIIGAFIAGLIVTMLIGINIKTGETKKGNIVVFIITAIITFKIIVSFINWV